LHASRVCNTQLNLLTFFCPSSNRCNLIRAHKKGGSYQKKTRPHRPEKK
jgi:hypothetical protein